MSEVGECALGECIVICPHKRVATTHLLIIMYDRVINAGGNHAYPALPLAAELLAPGHVDELHE